MPLHPNISLMSYVARQIKKLNFLSSAFNRFGVIPGFWSPIFAALFSLCWINIKRGHQLTFYKPFASIWMLPCWVFICHKGTGFTFPFLFFPLCCYVWLHRLPFSLTLDYAAPTVAETPGCVALCFQITFIPFFSHGIRLNHPARDSQQTIYRVVTRGGSEILQVLNIQQKLKPEHNYFGLESHFGGVNYTYSAFNVGVS